MQLDDIMILFPIEGHFVFSADPECHVDPGLSGNRPIRSSSWLLIKRLDSHPEWVSVCGFEWVLLVCDRKSKQDMALIIALIIFLLCNYTNIIIRKYRQF